MFYFLRIFRRTLRTWMDRQYQRRALREMDEDQLHDLGISRSEAMREAAKSFWQ